MKPRLNKFLFKMDTEINKQVVVVFLCPKCMQMYFLNLKCFCFFIKYSYKKPRGEKHFRLKFFIVLLAK